MSIINLDIFFDRIKNKIKIIETNDIYSILDDGERLIVDPDYYKYTTLPINNLVIGILDDETIKGKKNIEDNEDVLILPKNDENSKYLSIVCCPKRKTYIENNNVYKLIEANSGIFCLLFSKKVKIESHDEQEIALFLFTLQYYNCIFILNNYNKYGWIENFPAILKINDTYFIYMLKIKKQVINLDNFKDNISPEDTTENIKLRKKEYILGKFFIDDINVEKYKIDSKKEIEILEKYINIKPEIVFSKYF